MREIHHILAHYPPDCRPSQLEALGNAGGLSGAQFWRVHTPRGMLALRRWPAEHPTPDRLRFIHAVLRYAAENGIDFLPLPIATRNGQSFLCHGDRLWELAPWLDGSADFELSPSPARLRAAMAALGRFHLAVADFTTTHSEHCSNLPGEPAPSRHLARLRELTDQKINAWSRAMENDTWPELTPLARQFLVALPAAARQAAAKLSPLSGATFALQPCLRDIWHDHVLFTGEEVTGLVDFGAVAIDTPATDIARLLGSFASCPLPRFAVGQGEGQPSSNLWQQGLTAYKAVRPLTDAEQLAASALDASGAILAACNWIQWLYVENRQFENRRQIADRFRRLALKIAIA